MKLRTLFNVLPKNEKRKFKLLIVLQLLLSFLDLIAIALIAAIINIVTNLNEPLFNNKILSRLSQFINIPETANRDFIFVLGTFVVALFLIRTILSALALRYVFNYLGKVASKLSEILTIKSLQNHFDLSRNKTNSEILFALTNSVDVWAFGILGSLAAIASDIMLVTCISLGLFIYEFLVSFISICYFAIMVIFIHRITSKLARSLGSILSSETINSLEFMQDAFRGFRIMYVRNKSEFFAQKINMSRAAKLNANARMNFLPNIGKYIIELGLVIGVLMLSFFFMNAINLSFFLHVLVVFFIVASRVTPSLLRIQQNYFTMIASLPSALKLIELKVDFHGESKYKLKTLNLEFAINKGNSDLAINLQNLSYRFPDSDIDIFSNLNLHIQKGELIVVAGKSGIGKSTLVDCIIGLLKPTSGKVTIGKCEPNEFIQKNPNAIGFMPQETQIFEGDIKSNVCFGFETETVPTARVVQCLSQASLHEFANEKSVRIKIGLTGIQLSGGQKQRLGIARAILTDPDILILDEPTNMLDAQTTKSILETIKSLKCNSIVLVITHDETFMNAADKIIYLEENNLVVSHFQELREKSLKFRTMINEII